MKIQLSHNVFSVSTIDELINFASAYTNDNIEEYIIHCYKDQVDDFIKDEKEHGDGTPDEKRILDYIEMNYNLCDIAYSVIDGICEMSDVFIIAEGYAGECDIYLVNTDPQSKEEVIDYIANHADRLGVTLFDITEVLTIKKL